MSIQGVFDNFICGGRYRAWKQALWNEGDESVKDEIEMDKTSGIVYLSYKIEYVRLGGVCYIQFVKDGIKLQHLIGVLTLNLTE